MLGIRIAVGCLARSVERGGLTLSVAIFNTSTSNKAILNMVKPSRQPQQLQTMLLAFVIALLLGSHAEALHITVAGHTVDLGNPLGHQQGGHSAPHTGSNANLASALCPVASIGNVQLTPFPMRTDDVCGSFGLNVANNAYACVAFGQMGSLLGNPPLRCAPDAVPVHPDTDPQGECRAA